jgi:hypothetical protein
MIYCYTEIMSYSNIIKSCEEQSKIILNVVVDAWKWYKTQFLLVF